ncbi:MAG TPA: antibiotic biosynthesis monooxygenase [Verrucomicrobiae bacterium]|jgi:heme-degrading monooxygenase HmoA|nr:antibiotic biosynthesis monooxygenase [Verrucomicrobiae bacterium]
MVITLFRSRLRPEHEKEYTEWAARMHEIAIKMPGFISIKTFSAEDGERVSVVEFESEETMRRWREQPDHRQAQELGQKMFYSEYRIQVCQPIRDYSFPKKTGAHATSV